MSTQEFSCTPTGGTALLLTHQFVSKRRMEAGSAEEKVPLNSNYFVLFVVLMRCLTALRQVGILIKQTDSLDDGTVLLFSMFDFENVYR